MSATTDPRAAADPQQAQLLERLRAAKGAPLSFAELRAHGIENPAVLCYELELAGTPIDRVRCEQGPQRPVAAGVRVEQAARRPPAPRIPVAPRRRRLPPRAPRAHGPRARARRVTVALTLAAIALALGATALALLDRGGVRRVRVASAPVRHLPGAARSRHTAVAVHPAQAPPAQAARPAEAASAGTAVASAPSPAPSGASAAPPVGGYGSADAGRLQAEGHELIARGDYAAAIADLRAALAASGLSTPGCAAPTGEACLTYAYALYDLGHALRLAGDPHAAMAVLGERLRIDNQRATVLAELRLAAAGTNAPSAPGAPAAPLRQGDRGHRHNGRSKGRAELP